MNDCATMHKQRPLREAAKPENSCLKHYNNRTVKI
nr:MAG TPA: hypothetical protein [Caudoviricetes sp.]